MYKFNLFLVGTLLFVSAALFSAEDLVTRASPLSEMYNETKASKSLPRSELNREKSGPFISSNTGFGFLYNKYKYMLASPVYEAIFGYHIGNAYKIGVSYQYQHAPLDVQFQGRAVIAGNPHAYDYLINSGLNLQTASLKLYTSLPKPYRWKIFTFYPDKK